MSGITHKDARFEIDLFQGRGGASGLSPFYLPGDDPGLVLSRFGRRSSETIGESDDELALEDGRVHTVALERDGDGTMTASVDGEELIRVKSSALDDPFGGLSLVNSAATTRSRSIAIYGDD